MKINLAKSAGFCFGVKRAIQIARDSAAKYSGIEMLGDIVHNDDVVRSLSASGIKRISRLKNGKGKTLLIRAHGIPRRKLNKARELRYSIIDATCPMVKEIHDIARDMEKKRRKIIVIGDKKHEEVKGIVGQIGSCALVIDVNTQPSPLRLKRLKKAAVVVQSTQNIDKVMKTAGFLRAHIPDLKFFNTICHTTRLKQSEIKKLPLENDVMVIIGSRKSANTKRLYEISKSLNPKSHWIESPLQVKKIWFKGARTVGVTAGASTPEFVTRNIIKRIRDISTK